MLRQLILPYVFFLFSFGAPAFAHEGHAHSESDENVAVQIHEEFLHYLKSSEFNSGPSQDVAIEINGRRYLLNSSFYELLRLTLKAASPETCGSCVVEEVKKQSRTKEFLSKVKEGVKELFDRQTVARGATFLDEYGYAAGVGYILMEVLEHTAMGPLGICPILNLYYLYALDVIKQSQYVFVSTYKTSIVKAIYFSFRSGFETFRLNRALKKPVFENEDGASQKSWNEFKTLRKEQGRYKWFLWKNWLDQKLSKRTLWPTAYLTLDLEKADAHEGHEHASPFKLLQAQPLDGKPSGLSFLKCETVNCSQEDSRAREWWNDLDASDHKLYREVYERFQSTSVSDEELISFAFRLRDIRLITDAQHPIEERFLAASALQDVLIFEFHAIEAIYHKQLNAVRNQMSVWQYIKAFKRFHNFKVKIKKYGSFLKSLAMEKEQVPVYLYRQALLDLSSILGLFEKASSLIERQTSLTHLLDPIYGLNSCQDILTQ